jgi:hypothetical protein
MARRCRLVSLSVRQRGSARGLAWQARSVVFRQVRAWPGRARQAQRGRSRHVATLSCSCRVSQCKAVFAVSRAFASDHVSSRHRNAAACRCRLVPARCGLLVRVSSKHCSAGSAVSGHFGLVTSTHGTLLSGDAGLAVQAASRSCGSARCWSRFLRCTSRQATLCDFLHGFVRRGESRRVTAGSAGHVTS